jgi:hypothetical protein
MMLTAVMVLGALMAVPGVRAFVQDMYLGIVSYIQGDGEQPVPIPTPVAPWDPRLKGETDLGSLIDKYGDKVKLPTYPSGLGLPDHTYIQDVNYPLMLYVWLDHSSNKPAMVLYQLTHMGASGPGMEELGHDINILPDVRVGRWKGAWVEGQYMIPLAYEDARDSNITSTRQLVEGNTLVWYDEETDYTYKLVSSLTMGEAIKIGASVKPLGVPPTPYPTSTPVSPVSRLDLVGETALFELSQTTGFRIKIPALADMPELVSPDKVYLQGSPGLPGSGQVVVMVWFVPGRLDDLRLVLTQGIEDVTAWPDNGVGIETASVNGAPARWVQAPQSVYVEGPDGKSTLAERTLVTNSHALVWQEGSLHYRLETSLPLEEAIRIAESLR